MQECATHQFLPSNMTRSDIDDFLFREARLQDEHRYQEWESLWSEDGIYWVPAGMDDYDPEKRVSIIYDNRVRIRTRVRQLSTGHHLAQSPRSRLRRVMSNIEVMSADQNGVEVGSNFILAEVRGGQTTVWSGRAVHRLCLDAGTIKMRFKKVMLNNNAWPMVTMAFLI